MYIVSKSRDRQLFEMAMDYIISEDEFEDFVEEYDIEFYEEEIVYFGLEQYRRYLEKEGRIAE